MSDDSASDDGATTSAETSEPTGDATGDDDPPNPGTDDGSTDDTGSPAEGCEDQLVLDLGLVGGTISEGATGNTRAGAGWVSTVDASAGGVANAPTNPWIYLRFTPGGLEKVEVDDLQALESTEWDIAAKRFGIRLNSGDSGPSEIRAAALPSMAYEDVSELPAGTELTQESFYTADCVLIDDDSGQGAPDYLMTPWWSYPGCVATTGTPFVIELADGSLLKLVVDAYYESGQDACNTGGMMGTGSANFSWRWAYLE
ncbi:MAG: HmuY family protein [Nannocystaceae bacterium]